MSPSHDPATTGSGKCLGGYPRAPAMSADDPADDCGPGSAEWASSARPWSPARAAEPLPPLAPPPPAAGAEREPPPGRLSWLHSTRAAVALVAVVLVGVVLATRVDLAGTTQRPLSLDDVHVVVADGAGDPGNGGPVRLDPATSSITYSCTYVGGTRGEVLILHTSVSAVDPAAAASLPDVSAVTQGGVSGEVRVSVQGPATGLVPGLYTVVVRHDGHVLRSARFSVGPPAGAVSPTPGG